MKRFLIIFTLLLLGSLQLSGQIETPVEWSNSSKQVSPNTYEITFTATIDPGWHIYSQNTKAGGPIPTSFNFEKPVGYKAIEGAAELSKVHEEYDKSFEMDVLSFSDKAIFVQTIKTSQSPVTAKGYLEYMVCNDKKCLPPTAVDFEIVLKNTMKAETPKTDPKTDPDPSRPAGTPPAENETTTQGGGTAQASPAKTPTTEVAAKETEAKIEEKETVPKEGASKTEPESGIFAPVHWSHEIVKQDDGSHDIIFTAKMDKGWKVYSQFIEEGGPVPTEFTFTPGAYELIGKVTESNNVVKMQDEVFEMPLAFFKKHATFTQKIKFTGDVVPIKAEAMFMTCNEERCLPPDYKEFAIGGSAESAVAETQMAAGATGFVAWLESMMKKIDPKNPISDCGNKQEDKDEDGGLWGTFFLGMLGGFAALLTPCVFPMIPLTVSFFTKGSEDKKKGFSQAILYGLAITVIYAAITIPFHLMESVDGNILNVIGTSPILNLFFFVIFIAFAISFFGYFELTLPSGFVNKISSKSSMGGIGGTFFMAATLTLVSFSCTGPILGGLLGSSITGGNAAMALTAGFTGFGLALALPFTLFAIFPSMLNSLPQSGGWMTSVKVVLGFVELAFALKFLSNADLVWQAGLLKREIFFGIWILVGLGLAAYLFGLIRFPHDPPKAKLTPIRLGIGALTLAFVAYLIPGLMSGPSANRRLVSGFPPPLEYSFYHNADAEENDPHKLKIFTKLEEGLAYAKKVNKPVLFDFTGWACVNCRKMEENVWVEKEIFDRLNEEVVLISLYVDERTKLDETIELTLPVVGKKKLRTIGNKWATLQTYVFNDNSQPFYTMLTPDGKLLNKPVGYTPDVDAYKAFLDCGIKAYKDMRAVSVNE